MILNGGDGSKKKQQPVFVVSSGRSGSTLLAKMINRHPQILCVSDLFEPVGDIPYFKQELRVNGEDFFKTLSSPSLKQRIKYWRNRPTSELLFMPEDDNMVSLLLTYTLPFVTDGKPMDLYLKLEEETRNWEEDSMPNQLLRFFDWLRDQGEKELWVERTGGSLPHMKQMIETWPSAKFIYNYRDCRETAISMMTGSFFRLYLALTQNPELDEWDETYMPPLGEMGAMLNQWVVDAVAALEGVPDHQKWELRYEDLLDDTEATLRSFACFVFDREESTREDYEWAAEQSKVVKRNPLKFPALNPDQQAELNEACREGQKALGYE